MITGLLVRYRTSIRSPNRTGNNKNCTTQITGKKGLEHFNPKPIRIILFNKLPRMFKYILSQNYIH